MLRTMHAWAGTWAILVALTVLGCGSNSNAPAKSAAAPPTPAPAGPGAPRPAAEAPPQASSITPEELSTFTEKFVAAATAGNAEELDALIDMEAITARAAQDLELSAASQEGLKKSMAQHPSNMARQFATDLSKAANYDVLRTYEKDGTQHAVFRLVLADAGGLNYHDLELARSPDGQVKAHDMYIVAAGEPISQLLRRNLIFIARHESRNLLDRLTKKESAYYKHLPQLSTLTQLVQSGQDQEAMQLYNSLPPEVQQEKPVQIIRMRAAQRLSEDEYSQALSDISRLFGNDPAMGLLMIDGYLLKEQYDEAMQTVNQIDSSLGGDPYLNSLRANVLLLKGDLDGARKLSDRAVAEAPDVIDCYWGAITIALGQKDFDRVAEMLNAVGEKFELEFNDMTQIPEYAEFVQSPQYAQWVKSREGAAPAAD